MYRVNDLKKMIIQGGGEGVIVEDSSLPLLEVARKSLQSSTKPRLSPNPRLINHFALGADPELAIVNSRGQRLTASSFGLHTGLAIGADLSGRQAELRPQASKWALKVVGSLMREVGFLALHTRRVAGDEGVSLHATPYFEGDGYGGHVHFGRKRTALRGVEKATLAQVYDWMLGAGIFPPNTTRKRQGTGYGGATDTREQAHGFEYRGYPTWLDNPWMAYLTLTLSKLVIIEPEFAEGFSKNGELLEQLKKPHSFGKVASTAAGFLSNFLAYFQGMDDDAQLALWTLKRIGLPRWVGGDLRARWGFSPQNPLWQTGLPLIPKIYPPCIQAAQEDLQGLFFYFAYGEALAFGPPRPNWPAQITQGFYSAMGAIQTNGVIGLGEIAWGLCMGEKIPVGILASNGHGGGDPDLTVSTELEKYLAPNWKEKLREAAPWLQRIKTAPVNSSRMYVGFRLRQNFQIENAIRALTCGVFPIWKVGEESQAGLQEFLERRKVLAKQEGLKTRRMGHWGIEKFE